MLTLFQHKRMPKLGRSRSIEGPDLKERVNSLDILAPYWQFDLNSIRESNLNSLVLNMLDKQNLTLLSTINQTDRDACPSGAKKH
jgi:hypothetical protein